MCVCARAPTQVVMVDSNVGLYQVLNLLLKGATWRVFFFIRMSSYDS
jgi:hypothetical protein